ncbi:DUF6809 family protein [uncultured Faecalibaculum sp.]|uniref:DUF6809 family protein n=1 Tax=uncultured Faecalibaculum sp. TaxID=1729681 RepID=UPI001361EE24|nr:DUF6809 family protein [uncultured Faecalibaculum sp.]NBH28797.1 hypothetical protein [Lachnospiraceae bacterium]
MEVKNVLEQLYNGEIFPAEQYAPKSEEYRKIHQGHYSHYEDFIEVLAKELSQNKMYYLNPRIT